MNKKNLAKKFLMDNVVVDMELLNEIKDNPIAVIETMGGVANWYIKSAASYTVVKDAISYAGYKNKTSDRTWLTVGSVWREVVKQKLSMLV